VGEDGASDRALAVRQRLRLAEHAPDVRLRAHDRRLRDHDGRDPRFAESPQRRRVHRTAPHPRSLPASHAPRLTPRTRYGGTAREQRSAQFARHDVPVLETPLREHRGRRGRPAGAGHRTRRARLSWRVRDRVRGRVVRRRDQGPTGEHEHGGHGRLEPAGQPVSVDHYQRCRLRRSTGRDHALGRLPGAPRSLPRTHGRSSPASARTTGQHWDRGRGGRAGCSGRDGGPDARRHRRGAGGGRERLQRDDAGPRALRDRSRRRARCGPHDIVRPGRAGRRSDHRGHPQPATASGPARQRRAHRHDARSRTPAGELACVETEHAGGHSGVAALVGQLRAGARRLLPDRERLRESGFQVAGARGPRSRRARRSRVRR